MPDEQAKACFDGGRTTLYTYSPRQRAEGVPVMVLFIRPGIKLPLPVEVVLFDMDGVLVDVSGSYLRAVEETFTHFAGTELEPGTVYRYKDRGGFNDDWHLTQALLKDAGIEVPFGEIVEVFQRRYKGSNWDGLIAEEPALIQTETLEQLNQRFPMALATGRPEPEAQWTLERFGWSSFFPVIVGMEMQNGRGKPDPFSLLEALKLLDDRSAPPTRTAYIGDTVDDVKAARAAGCFAVGVVPPYLSVGSRNARLIEAGAHVVLSDVNAVPDVLTLPSS